MSGRTELKYKLSWSDVYSVALEIKKKPKESFTYQVLRWTKCHFYWDGYNIKMLWRPSNFIPFIVLFYSKRHRGSSCYLQYWKGKWQSDYIRCYHCCIWCSWGHHSSACVYNLHSYFSDATINDKRWYFLNILLQLYLEVFSTIFVHCYMYLLLYDLFTKRRDESEIWTGSSKRGLMVF